MSDRQRAGPADSDLLLGALAKPPAVVLSDLHMAHPATYCMRPEALRPLLAGAATAIFNGDSAELLSVEHKAEAADKLARLADLCRSEGALPLFLAGNHDPTVSTCHHLDLLGGRVFATHGDALHPGVAPWSRDAAAIWAERLRLLAGRPEPETLPGTLFLAKRAALIASRYEIVGGAGLAARFDMLLRFARQPWRIALALRYWASVPRLAQEMRDRHRPDARLMLVGHTHRAGVWDLPGFTLVNTGSFQPLSRTLLVRLEADRAAVWSVKRSHHEFRQGHLLRELPLPG